MLLCHSAVTVGTFDITAVCQRIVRLDCRGNCEPFFLGSGNPRYLPLRGKIRHRNVSYFAVLYQAVKGTGQLLCRLCFVVVVRVVEINVVRLETFKGVVDRGVDVFFGEPRGLLPAADFSSEEDLVAIATGGQVVAQESF